jgi:hypothetical protein
MDALKKNKEGYSFLTNTDRSNLRKLQGIDYVIGQAYNIYDFEWPYLVAIHVKSNPKDRLLALNRLAPNAFPLY